MTPDSSTLLDCLRSAVGSDHVLTDADLRASYETDWSRRWHGEALAVVRPASADEVAAVVRACAAAGVAIIPQGGNTGLVGGSVPRTHATRPQVVVSTLRLRELEPVDLLAGEVTVGAGATLGMLQAHVRPAGFGFGVDLGARDSATIGGMVATNAGGIHVLRHGPMRMQLVGVEGVLPAGSEGTLAIITRVRLRLVPLLPRRAVALLALDGTAAAVTLAGALRSSLPSLAAAELFFDEGLALVLRRGSGERPFREEYPAYLLLEVESRVDPTDDLAAAIDAAGDVVGHAVLASDGPGRERLWHLREGHTEAINAEGVPHKLDVALPLDRLAEFVDRVRAAVEEAAPSAACYLYGHVCDGNLHIGVIGPPAEDERVDSAILRLTIEMGGTISAEHGVGVAKVDWLEADRGTADVAAMRAIKRALDPGRILNPGVIFRD